MTTNPLPADYELAGRQTDIRTVDLMKGVWIVVVPDPDSVWVSHMWRKGHEIMTTKEEAEELCTFLRQTGRNAIVVRIAPEKVAE